MDKFDKLGQDLKRAVLNPIIKNGVPRVDPFKVEIEYVERPPLITRQERWYSAIKRGVKAGIGAGVAVLVTTGNPIYSAVAAVGAGVVGAGDKLVTETVKASGGNTAAVNPIDTVLKIIVEIFNLIKYYVGSTKGKR